MRHFDARCVERGIVSTDLEALWAGIKWAIESERDDLLDLALKTDTARYWRFRCPDGIFYAVTALDNSKPQTVLTQAMFRKKKWATKQRKRNKGDGSRLRRN